MMEHLKYPEFRITPDRRSEGIDPRALSGFYVRAADHHEASRAYWDAHPNSAPGTFALYIERWKEPVL